MTTMVVNVLSHLDLDFEWIEYIDENRFMLNEQQSEFLIQLAHSSVIPLIVVRQILIIDNTRVLVTNISV